MHPDQRGALTIAISTLAGFSCGGNILPQGLHGVRRRWSSGQAEGQINRTEDETVERAMYGRGIELLRARMLVLDHTK